MNLRERIEELGYHTSRKNEHLLIYLHGDYVTHLYRFKKTHPWVNKYGKRVDIFTIEKFLTGEK